MDGLIPLRPSNDSDFTKLSKLDKDTLVYAVIMQVSNQVAYLRFHPEYARIMGNNIVLNDSGKTECKHFFSYPKNREFYDAYKSTLEEFCKRKSQSAKATVDISENRKDRALNKLLSDCMEAINTNESLNPEVLKDFVTMAKALGVLKEEEEQIEPARRYIPIRCRSECQYRLFVEKAIENGEIENECDHCRALEYATDRGYVYDPTKNLNIPYSEE